MLLSVGKKGDICNRSSEDDKRRNASGSECFLHSFSACSLCSLLHGRPVEIGGGGGGAGVDAAAAAVAAHEDHGVVVAEAADGLGGSPDGWE